MEEPASSPAPAKNPGSENAAAKRKFRLFLMALKLFRAVTGITYQDLSIDTKFGRLNSRDTVPLSAQNCINEKRIWYCIKNFGD